MTVTRRWLDAGYRIINTPPLSGLLRSSWFLWDTAALLPSTARDAVLRGSDEKSFDESGRREADRLKPFLRQDAVVLDLACGIGRVLKYVAPLCGHAYGVDVSARMLGHARRRLAGLGNVSLQKNNGKDLGKFADDTFDLVYSFLTFLHLEREDAYVYLEEAYRVLKPSGTLFVQFADLLSDTAFEWFAGYAHTRSRQAARVRPTTDREVERLLSKAGFLQLDLSREGDYLYACAVKP